MDCRHALEAAFVVVPAALVAGLSRQCREAAPTDVINLQEADPVVPGPAAHHAEADQGSEEGEECGHPPLVQTKATRCSKVSRLRHLNAFIRQCTQVPLFSCPRQVLSFPILTANLPSTACSHRWLDR